MLLPHATWRASEGHFVRALQACVHYFSAYPRTLCVVCLVYCKIILSANTFVLLFSDYICLEFYTDLSIFTTLLHAKHPSYELMIIHQMKHMSFIKRVLKMGTA
jgi:hypothetical protein